MRELSMTAPATTLARDGVSLWRQIAHALRDEVVGGATPPGARLPTEAEMAARFGVNRHTIRRALEELSRDGLIRVEQGRGAFVAEDVLDYQVEPRTRFSAWIRRNEKEPSGRMLRVWEGRADRRVTAGLGVAPGSPVALAERLGLADGRPVVLGLHHFPLASLPGILDALRGASGITVALALVGVADYVRRSTRVSARLPTHTEATLLRTPRNRPVLECENVNVDLRDRIVEFGIARYPTPRVQIVFEPQGSG